MVDRREFLTHSALVAVLAGLPALAREQVLCAPAPPVPPSRLYETDPEAYWRQLRSQWVLPADRVNLNCGSVGCTPLPVLQAMVDHLLHAEEFTEPYYPWFGYEENPPLREVRDALAAFLNIPHDELALVRNATEANNTVGNGLDLRPGDEVLLTDQEHPGGRCVWELKAARYGIRLREVVLPKPPASVDQIVEAFERAITPRTRIIAFSHITTVTGVVLPVREICALARQKGLLTHVDGAHAIGQLPLDISGLGCDFYASSPHKWLLAPKGTGFLFIREPLQNQLWVHTASGSWRDTSLKAYRFSNLGTSNLSVMVGLKAALDFYRAIGPDRIYRRIHEMASRVRAHLEQRPEVRIVNASADPFYGGMVSFEPVRGSLQKVLDECARRQIRVAGSPERIRISTHIFTLPEDLERFFEALDAGLAA